MSNQNPLQKYFRQPKIYISLPSKGLYYEPGSFQGDYNQVPIFAMTGMDEILFKTPDALFNGDATMKVIESCCPYIKNAKMMPSVDVDAVLVAIKIATFGEMVSVSHACRNCATEADYEINLSSILDHFSNLKFTNNVKINDELSIKIRPLQYAELTHFSIENFKLQKMLIQIADMPEDDRQAKINEIYDMLTDIQIQLFLTSIENIQIPGQVVEDKAYIEEWLRNSDRVSYDSIKKKLEANREEWDMPKHPITCASCGHQDEIQITLDQSSFFG